MFEELRKRVYEANMGLLKHDLVKFTWGNVSAIDESRKYMIIKPSGVAYEKLSPENMVVVDMDGNVVEGDLNPSSDSQTHLVLYKEFKDVWGVVHTHSPWAVVFSQAKKPIPCFGTTHADTFYGEVPCARDLTREEIEGEYEVNTGKVIVECFKDKDYIATPAVLCSSHGPFTWGNSPENALYNAAVLEEVAKMSYYTMGLGHNEAAFQYLQDKHYMRKHGPNAYYGQK